MKAKNLLAVLTIVVSLILSFSACKKDKEASKQECKTCMAKENVEGAVVQTEQVCSDEAEQTFRNTYSDYNVSCQ
jgi:hypothetical protein